jgi:hypothetical protein
MANDKNHDYESGLTSLGKALGRNDADMVQAVRIGELEEHLEHGVIPQGGIAHQRLSQLYNNMANRIKSDREAVSPKYRVIDSPDDILDAAFTLPEPEEKQSILPPQLPPKHPSAARNGGANFLAASPH